VQLHNPLLAYEVGEEFVEWWRRAERGEFDPFLLVMEGSIPNERILEEGYWAAFGTDPDTGQPITTCEWIDRLAPKAWAIVAAGTCSAYGGVHAMSGNPTGAMDMTDYLGADWRSPSGPARGQRPRLPGPAGQPHGDPALPALPDQVQIIHRAGSHLTALIEDVLEIEEGALPLSIGPVPVEGAVREAAELVAPMATERRISMAADPVIPPRGSGETATLTGAVGAGASHTPGWARGRPSRAVRHRCARARNSSVKRREAAADGQ
jgi:hypothetical protein